VSQPDLTRWMDRTPNHTVVIENSQHNQRVERVWIPDHQSGCYCKNPDRCARCSWLGYLNEKDLPCPTVCLRTGKYRPKDSIACILFSPSE